MATTLDEATIARDANRRIRRSGNVAGWAFAGPSVFIVLGLSFIPMIWAAYLSLTDSNLLSAGHFIGLAAGLGVAIMLNRKIKLIGFYRTCFLVPFIASAAAEGLLFGFIFDPDFGIVNAGLQAVGLPRQGFLQNPSQALVVLAIVYFWTQFGFNIVIYLAALQDIPQEVLEAASIDGASRWSTFRNVVVPV